MTFHQVRLHHKPLLGALLLTAMLAACGENDDLQAGQPATGAGKHYVSLTFTMPTQDESSRAVNPTGGEGGDGYEQGQDNENTITDAVAFFFQNNGAGVNGDAYTPVQYLRFTDFNQPEDGNGNPIDRTYTSKPIPTSLYGEYNVLVVANPGTDNWWTETTTLGAVRDKILTEAWTGTDGNETNFLMSSAKDSTIQISDANNTVSTAANTTVDVERMAARVDYKTLNSYTIEEDEDYKGATVKIEGAILVNNLTGPGSYAMKRVSTATTGGTINYLGDETLGTGGLPNNWVIDPTTGSKETGATFGVSWKDTNADNPNWWNEKATSCKAITKEDGDWNILGYTLENITAPDETKHEYNTAVVFKAKFTPADGKVSHYQEGATFFEYNGIIYASMEDMIEDFYDKKISDMDAAVMACASWEYVEDFASDLKGIDPSGYKQWLQGQIDKSKTLDDVMKNSLTWTSYMLNECGYSATLANGKYSVKVDQGKVTADILADYGTRTYEDATCYYTWWIRHANDGDDKTNGVMEYAIVRNNIYELNVESIYSLGGYIPNEEEHGFIVTVYVKDWTMLEGETIQM